MEERGIQHREETNYENSPSLLCRQSGLNDCMNIRDGVWARRRIRLVKILFRVHPVLHGYLPAAFILHQGHLESSRPPPWDHTVFV